jgi:hypothetical protein
MNPIEFCVHHVWWTCCCSECHQIRHKTAVRITINLLIHHHSTNYVWCSIHHVPYPRAYTNLLLFKYFSSSFILLLKKVIYPRSCTTAVVISLSHTSFFEVVICLCPVLVFFWSSHSSQRKDNYKIRHKSFTPVTTTFHF